MQQHWLSSAHKMLPYRLNGSTYSPFSIRSQNNSGFRYRGRVRRRRKLRNRCYKSFAGRESLRASILNHSPRAKASGQMFWFIRRVRKPPTDCSGPFASRESFRTSVLDPSQGAKASARVFWFIRGARKLQNAKKKVNSKVR